MNCFDLFQMLWLVKRVDDDTFLIVDEDVVDGVAAVGKRVKIKGEGFCAILKASGTRKALNVLKKSMEDGASTPDPKKRVRRNVSVSISALSFTFRFQNMIVSSPPSTNRPSISRRASTVVRPTVSSLPSTLAPGPSQSVAPVVQAAQTSASVYLPLNASAGLNNGEFLKPTLNYLPFSSAGRYLGVHASER